MNIFKSVKPLIVAACICFSITPSAQAAIAVLDGYAYILTDEVLIDSDNLIIDIQSSMTQCEQANGDLPLDTAPLALHVNSQFIGLLRFEYSIIQGKLYFDSETGDLICDNGFYVDTIHTDSFE